MGYDVTVNILIRALSEKGNKEILVWMDIQQNYDFDN